MILKNKKAFTLIELMIALMLSAIIVFFSYTMTIYAYRMFTKLNEVSYTLNNMRFFEEAIKKSITNAARKNSSEQPIQPHTKILVFRRYDANIKDWVTDTYSFSKSDASFSIATNDYETYPDKIPNSALFAPSDLFLETESDTGLYYVKILLLKNVRAFYYRRDKTGTGSFGTHLNLSDLTIGIVYDDDSSNVVKRENRSFCFTVRSVYV